MQVLTPARRRSLRLRHHDYAEPAAYFVTICTQERVCIFGEIAEGEMVPNALGTAVLSTWRELPGRFDGLELDECAVMPNHFHGIVTLAGAATTLGEIVGALKSLSSFRINLKRGTRGSPVWQRGFYDHVIRDDRDLARIREYIQLIRHVGLWTKKIQRQHRRAG